jgi:DNA-directed RNA polymerase specialized sigma24 family protein
MRQPNFHTTRWSLVAQAGNIEADQHRQQALEQLCGDYWYPLYAFLRRKGHSPQQAEDTTQGFLASVLSGSFFAAANPDRGRFRTFLLVALQRFAGHEAQHQNALKRGGGLRRLSLDHNAGEQRYQLEATNHQTPESLFERQWALTVLRRALDRVEKSYVQSGKRHLFDALRSHLDGSDGAAHANIAERFEMTEGAVKAAAHRLRERYRQAVREEVSETLDSADNIDDEIRSLMAAVQA